MFPHPNFELRSKEEVEIEWEKVGRGKCVSAGCENDVAGNYKLCREHISPLLGICHKNLWISDESFLKMCGIDEETIKWYRENFKYGFELLE